MEELVTVEQADAFFRALAWAGPLLGVLAGLIAGHLRGRLSHGLLQGLAIGLLGPLVFGLWLLYGHMVRYDPATGVAGLHRVSVHAIAALTFIVVGVVIGWVYRRFVFTEVDSDETQVAGTGAQDATDVETHGR